MFKNLLLSKSVLSGAVLASVFVAVQAQTVPSADAENIQVSAQRKAIKVSPSAPPLDAKQPTSQISKEFIQNNIIALASYDDVVKFAPSVWDQSPNGPGLGKFETMSMRGFQDSQYNVTFDGIPFGDATDFHHTSSSLFIAHDLGEAEIDRGPGDGATIGNATFGGTFGFVSKEPLAERTATVYGTYGSWNTRAAGAEFDSGALPIGNFFIDAQHEDSNGYLTGASERRSNVAFKDVAHVRDLTITAYASYNHAIENTTQGATLAEIQSYGPSYGLGNNPALQSYAGYQPSNYISDFEYIRFQMPLAYGWSLDDTGYTNSFAHDYIESTDASQNDAADNGVTFYSAAGKKGKTYANDIPGKLTDAWWRAWGNTLRLSDDTAWGTIKTGVWFDRNNDRRDSLKNDLTQGDIPIGTKYGTIYTYAFHDSLTTLQPYVQFDWKALPGLTISPGFREGIFTRHMEGLDKTTPPTNESFVQTWHAPLPSIAAHYMITPQWSAYAQAAKGFLAPEINVLESLATSPSVKPEQTWNYQIGTTARLNKWIVGLDAYYIDFDNYVTSTTTNGIATYYNGGGAIYQGVESELQYVIGKGWSIYGNATYNSAKYKGTDVWIAEAPEDTASLGLLYDDKSGPYGSIIAKWIGSRFGDDVGATTLHQDSVGLDPYVTADLAVGYNFKRLFLTHDQWTVSVKVSNLFNNTKIDDYAGTQSADSANLYWTIPARSYFLNLSASY